MTNAKFRCVLVSAVCACAGVAAAQIQEQPRRIEGVVLDAMNAPVPGSARLVGRRPDGRRATTSTDAQGRFVLANVGEATGWCLRAEAAGTCVAETFVRPADGGAMLSRD